MLLKSLELQGFKSFADKTVLDLTSNITAIVGPNGSGKSNITDAVRWLLGERDARNLRGGKVEDLIFAGTEGKPRMGMAQATLTFDNSSKFFPVDFNEVSISRKVSRDGESLYFLNKAEVRLKDIIDFFAKSKLGARGLTIITQGSSDMFIRATPTERKEMVEEILGLKEYQIKKTDSIRKLKNTNINLETVMATLEELRPHLRFLKRQVSRYEERDSLAVELIKLENNFFGRKFKFFNSDLINFRSQLERIDKLIVEEEKIQKTLDVSLDDIKTNEPGQANDFRELEGQKNDLLKKRGEMERELGKLEARIEYETRSEPIQNIDSIKALKDIKTIAESLSQETDLNRLREKISLIIEKVDEAFGESKSAINKIRKEVSPELKALNGKLLADLKSIDDEVKKLIAKEEEIRKNLSNYNKSFTAKHEESEVQKKKLNTLYSDKNRLSFDIEKTELRISNLKEELMQAGRSIESMRDVVLEDLPNGMTDDEVTRRMFKLRGDLAGIGDIDQNLIKEAKDTEERFNFLTQQVKDLEAAIQDLKILIKDLDSKLHHDFTEAIKTINDEFGKLMKMMFGGGTAKLVVQVIEHKNLLQEVGDEDNRPDVKSGSSASNQIEDLNEVGTQGIEIEVSLPKKRIKGLEVLSGGERTLVSIAVIFALISVSPPPFLVLDEVDAALDEGNARRCSQILKEFAHKTQFLIVTHNRATMEVANVLYGVTMQADGTSKMLSLKLSLTS